jgi:DNA-binding GntR family transcriptional regulator
VIFDALAAHEPAEAERMMINHMDSLIEDVSKYWEEFK